MAAVAEELAYALSGVPELRDRKPQDGRGSLA